MKRLELGYIALAAGIVSAAACGGETPAGEPRSAQDINSGDVNNVIDGGSTNNVIDGGTVDAGSPDAGQNTPETFENQVSAGINARIDVINNGCADVIANGERSGNMPFVTYEQELPDGTIARCQYADFSDEYIGGQGFYGEEKPDGTQTVNRVSINDAWMYGQPEGVNIVCADQLRDDNGDGRWDNENHDTGLICNDVEQFCKATLDGVCGLQGTNVYMDDDWTSADYNASRPTVNAVGEFIEGLEDDMNR